MRGRNRNFTPAQIDEICQRYQAGENLSPLARRYGVVSATIRYHLTQRGIPRRPQGLRTDEHRARIREKALLRWQDPAFRAKRSAATHQLWQNPTYRRKLTKHGHATLPPSPTYTKWVSLITSHRAEVCADWQRFPSFLRAMGECPPGMKLGRLDPQHPYGPSNCRWVPRPLPSGLT